MSNFVFFLKKIHVNSKSCCYSLMQEFVFLSSYLYSEPPGGNGDYGGEPHY